ncbi:hypothetical protein I7I50_09615 [Histoplasma capsulatum G186AR]|uniref:Uncharacterized protein n=1 Tax=Ajellomyces capsulatus TaxID=5037 RepID=A0A8H7YSM2_AJECA|nr:hypothetical protein I7I52_07145 [Histoplasma capsulatum]QSS74439.1 hypothetical protein I7I50_09615 [Histoplasma capsulatum G186AR]
MNWQIDNDNKSSELHLPLCTHSPPYNNIFFSSLSSSSFLLLSTHHDINHGSLPPWSLWPPGPPSHPLCGWSTAESLRPQSTIQGSPGSPRARCTLRTRQHDRAAGSKPPAIVHQCHPHSISRPAGATRMPCLPECSSRSSAIPRMPSPAWPLWWSLWQQWRDHAIRCSVRDGEGVEVIEIVDDEEDGPQRRMGGPPGQRLLTAGSTPAAPIILD